jgi:hypothetical protein
MPAKPKKTRSRNGKPSKTPSKMKLVGYMEEREIADRIRRGLKAKGIDTTEILRNAYRGALDGAEADQWTMKESILARRIGLHKETIARMRRANKLQDEQGPLWSQHGTNFLYDVARSRAFFLGAGAALVQS